MRKIGLLAFVILPLAVCLLIPAESSAQGEAPAGAATGQAASPTPRSAAGQAGGEANVTAPQGPATVEPYRTPAPNGVSSRFSVQPGGWLKIDVSEQSRSPLKP